VGSHDTTREQRWVLALASAASLMVSLDVQVVATALPVIRLHLNASLAALKWTVNAYTLSFAVLLLTGAALGERLGRRRMLAAGVGLFTGASAACALAPGAGALVAARAIQGVRRVPGRHPGSLRPAPGPAGLHRGGLLPLLYLTLRQPRAQRLPGGA
jgi:MFS family permease